jgi:hypothetical protein
MLFGLIKGLAQRFGFAPVEIKQIQFRGDQQPEQIFLINW